MSWPEATYRIVVAICAAVAFVAFMGGFFGIDININRKDD